MRRGGMFSLASCLARPCRFGLSSAVGRATRHKGRGLRTGPVSANLNQVTLIGRAGAPPEIRYLEGGPEAKSVANFSIAVNRTYARDSETDWFDCEIWDKNAQMATDFIKKGSKVCVTGSLITNKWVDKQTQQQRKAVKIRVKTFELLDSKGAMDGGQPQQYGNTGQMQDFDNAPYDPHQGVGGQPPGMNMAPGGGYASQYGQRGSF